MNRRSEEQVWLDEIAALANGIALFYFPNSRIEPEQIAREKGITFSYGHYEDAFDGMLEFAQGRFHIYCNLDRLGEQGSPRARFTFGHELGHYFIDGHRNALEAGLAPAHPSRSDYESKMQVEREADCFASNLLMPLERFRQKAKRVELGFNGIIQLSGAFGTSVMSTAIRYVDAEVIPCALIKWTTEHVAWKSISSQALDAYFRDTITRTTEIPRGSATARAIAGEKSSDTHGFRSGATASDWFRYVNPYGSRNVILIEEAISLGRFGVLTLLYPDGGQFEFNS